MDEPKEETKEPEKPKEPEEVKPAEDTGKGDLPKTTPLIDIANAAAERMEKANEETAKLLARQEELEQRRALGGRTEAGAQPEKPKEETPHEYRERIEKELSDGKHQD